MEMTVADAENLLHGTSWKNEGSLDALEKPSAPNWKVSHRDNVFSQQADVVPLLLRCITEMEEETLNCKAQAWGCFAFMSTSDIQSAGKKICP